MTYDTLDPKARREIVDALNDEYEASTPGADVWRDRLAQRHRFGRVLDMPPAEARDDLSDARAVLWVLAAALALWLLAGALIWWLTRG